MRKYLSFFFRLIHPGYSWCRRCKMPWASVKSHDTFYSENSGCFSLCKTCWKDLTIEQRLPYYRLLWLSWKIEYRPEWKLIEYAVREGK